MSPAHLPLAHLLPPVARLTPLARGVLLAVVGALLLTLAAKVKVPFYPVPMTLQTLVVLLIGATCGWRLGAATVLLYLAQGAAGLPVFTNTPPVMAGPAYFFGPTGGFLAGFVASAAIVGFAVERGALRSLPRLFGAMLLAQVVVFAMGTAWLAFGAQMASGATGIGLDRALAVAVQPFALGDLLKTALAALLTFGLARRA
jgi:biotin transport system substrate-specific component